MAMVKVELLVSAVGGLREEGLQKYDIITIQPTGYAWGTGDLTARFVFCTELDVICGNDWKIKKRCGGCEYKGIDWPTEPPIINDTIGRPKVDCDIQRFEAADTEYKVEMSSQGFPVVVNFALHHKFGGKLDYSSFPFLSEETKESVENEELGTYITDSEKLQRLINARTPQNAVNRSDLSLKWQP